MEGKIFKISMLLLALAVLCTAAGAAEGSRLKLVTTTSLHDTGLLDVIKQKFEEKFNISLDVISVGTGIAIQYGERGDADVLLIHDKNREIKFVNDGYGLERRCVAYNYFNIVGPKDDPAGIKGMNATQAFKTIFQKGSSNPANVKFVSSGDGSGTHSKEQSLWKAAGYNYSQLNTSANRWYLETGSGMGATLVMTNEKSAYTLTDTSTFMAFKGNLTLVPLVEDTKDLLNVYTAIAENPKKHPGVNCEMANKFINFLVSEEGQKLISSYGMGKYRKPLFFSAKGNCSLIGCTSAECVVPTSASCATA